MASKLRMQVVIFSLPSQLKVQILLKKVKILNQLQPNLQETGVSKLETAVSFYDLTPQKSAKIEGFFLARYFQLPCLRYRMDQ